MSKLKGQELLAYVQANPGLDMPTMLTNAGYSTIRNGKASLKKLSSSLNYLPLKA